MKGKIGLWLLIPLALFGMFVGGLMTWHHDTQLYGGADDQGELIGCTESAEVNCDVVNTSDYSELAGVPIATLAIPFYATVLLLAALALKGRPGARGLLVGMGLLATIYSIFLYGISKTELHYVCAWCMRLYVVNISVLVLSLLGGKPERPDQGTLVLAGGAFLALNLIAVGGERGYRSSLSGSVGGPALSAVVAEKAETRGKDPTGPAPQRTFNVKTEDDKDTTFSLDPDDAWTGNPDAAVSVVMFGDLECGYCKRTGFELRRL